jgi:hypothetical protein
VRIDKWECIRLKSFCIAKDTVNRVKGQSVEWEIIFGRGLISKIYEELKNIIKEKISQ